MSLALQQQEDAARVGGQIALRRFDSEYSSVFRGEKKEAHTWGRRRKKPNPDPKLFSSKSMYFAIILLGI